MTTSYKKSSIYAIAILGIVFAASIPFWGSPTFIQFCINALILATLAQSWNIIGGYTGYPSFGNSVFYGLGGYGVAVSMLQFNLPFSVGLGVGVILAVLAALLLGLPVLRLRGHYFAIATLALALAMIALVSNISFFGGNIGLVLPIGPSDTFFYELSLALLIFATLTVAWISNSRFGLGLISIRENELTASVMGINTTLYKVIAFVLSSFFTSLAGGIHAYWITFLDPASAFDISLNVKMIIMTVFGGAGTVLGPLLGAFSLTAISELLAAQITNFAGLFFGFIIVAAILFVPKGCMDLIRRYRTQRH
jgi:branched-chain amino acid transport system permease protein